MSRLNNDSNDIENRKLNFFLRGDKLNIEDVDLGESSTYELVFDSNDLVDGCYVRQYFANNSQMLFVFGFTKKGGDLIYVKQVISYKVTQHFSSESLQKYLEITDPKGFAILKQAQRKINSGFYEDKYNSNALSIEDHLKKGLDSYNKENYKDAKLHLIAYINNDGKDIVANFAAGVLHFHDRDFDFAKKCFRNVIEKYDHIKSSEQEQYVYTESATIIASICYSQGDFFKAVQYSSKVISVNPNLLNARFTRALAKSNLEDRFGAISDYDFILTNSNLMDELSTFDLATIYNNKAYSIFLSGGDIKDAMNLVEKALKINQNHSYIWSSRGEFNLILENYQEAIKDLNRSITLKPDGLSYYLRGIAYIKSGNRLKGCSDLSLAGELGYEKAYKVIKEDCNK